MIQKNMNREIQLGLLNGCDFSKCDLIIDNQLKISNGRLVNSSGYDFGEFKYDGLTVTEYLRDGNSIKYLKAHPDAREPTRGSQYAAGLDLYSVETVNLEPWSTTRINTGVIMEIPHLHYGRIAERSGLALKGIAIGGGVVDSDYRGEIAVILRNMTDKVFEIKLGDKIAQIIIEPYSYHGLKLVESLSETERDRRGFGSSG